MPFEEHETLFWCRSLEEAIHELRRTEDEIYIIGGGSIYEQMLPLSHTIYATEVNVELDGDTYFPKINQEEWTRESLASFSKNERNQYDFEVVRYQRKDS